LEPDRRWLSFIVLQGNGGERFEKKKIPVVDDNQDITEIVQEMYVTVTRKMTIVKEGWCLLA
jgi:hypothetical protein